MDVENVQTAPFAGSLSLFWRDLSDLGEALKLVRLLPVKQKKKKKKKTQKNKKKKTKKKKKNNNNSKSEEEEEQEEENK